LAAIVGRGSDPFNRRATGLAARWLRCVGAATPNDQILTRELSDFGLRYLLGAIHFPGARAEQKIRIREQEPRAVGAPESRRRTAPPAARREPAAQSPGTSTPAAEERTGAEERAQRVAGRGTALAESAVLRPFDPEERSVRGQSRSADAVQ